ncbi:hypothetical protein SLI_6433 [Streptomyces lividans 1326]|uniref:Uncharacterized protein n=1 Tax=Streptomyces lividans 1326 TaxID=1200984 RepID=A0A7U9DZB7_STRLI|nr:hypothetical protein SLI_6433 [Streptomyces lividans 1326]
MALRVTGGGLVADVAAGVLGRGAGRVERPGRVLDLNAQGDGADDVGRGELRRRARTGAVGPALTRRARRAVGLRARRLRALLRRGGLGVAARVGAGVRGTVIR